MNPTPNLLRLGLAVGAACALASCEVYEGYPGGGYASAGYSSGGGYYDDGYDDDFYEYRPSYTAYSMWGPAHSYYYGGSYYSHSWWYDDDYRRYCRERDAHHARHSSNHRGEPVKLVRYRENDPRRVPSGYHSPEWYKSHGFSLKQNTYKDRDGDLHGRQPQSSHSNQRQGSSRSSASHSSSDRGSSAHSSSNRGGSDRGGESKPAVGFSRYSHPTTASKESSNQKEHSSSGGSDDHGHKKK